MSCNGVGGRGSKEEIRDVSFQIFFSDFKKSYFKIFENVF